MRYSACSIHVHENGEHFCRGFAQVLGELGCYEYSGFIKFFYCLDGIFVCFVVTVEVGEDGADVENGAG